MSRRCGARPFILSLSLVATVSCHAQPSQGQPSVSRTTVHALARLEPEQGLVTIMGPPGSRIAEIPVKVGQSIKKGHVLLSLEGYQSALEQLKVAEAEKAKADFLRELKVREVQLARKQYDQLQDARMKAQREVIALLENSYDVSNSELTGLKEELVGKQRITSQRMLTNKAKAELVDAKTRLRELEVAQANLAASREIEDRRLSATSPEYQVLSRQVDLAAALVAQTIILAPSDGVVLNILGHVGESAGSGPVLYFGDNSRMVAVAEVYQTDVVDLEVGAQAELRIQREDVAGAVKRIGLMVGRNRLVSLNPAQPTDRRVIEVVIALNDSKLASRYVNMEVEVAIRLGPPNNAP